MSLGGLSGDVKSHQKKISATKMFFSAKVHSIQCKFFYIIPMLMCGLTQTRIFSGYQSDSTERPESAPPSGSQSTASSERQLTEAVTVHKNLACSMYFV
jgi:hypothetical protein